MKKIIAFLLAAVLVFALFGCQKADEPETTAPTTTTETTTKAPDPVNPLTGEKKYNKKAIGKRPVAIVVENLSPARPQWAIGSSDIIMEGEVEGGISRMLWIYADYTSVPDKVGPLRSARPSYVKFAKLFDAVYIHWGGSHSKQDYIGGYETIKRLKVDDIDGMAGGELFGRDQTRAVDMEHRGTLDGTKIAKTIKSKKYRTKIADKATSFSFNEKAAAVGTDAANSVGVKFSSITDTRRFTYNTDDKKYHTNDWMTDVSFTNLIILRDSSKYITTPYQRGGSVTYLNYDYKGGNGFLVSQGTKTAIKWDVKDGTLNLTTEDGKEVKLNPGKSYIGFSSTNHEGKVTFE